MKKQSLFHVWISEPEKVRKDLLEATRATISCLQRYEKFKSVREDKQKAIEDFSHIINEIYNLNVKLNNILPKTGLRTKETKPGKQRKIKKKENKTKERETQKPRQSELEIIEKELAKIDSALSKLK